MGLSTLMPSVVYLGLDNSHSAFRSGTNNLLCEFYFLLATDPHRQLPAAQAYSAGFMRDNQLYFFSDFHSKSTLFVLHRALRGSESFPFSFELLLL